MRKNERALATAAGAQAAADSFEVATSAHDHCQILRHRRHSVMAVSS